MHVPMHAVHCASRKGLLLGHMMSACSFVLAAVANN